MYNDEWHRMLLEEERKLLREVTDEKEPMSWQKLGKMIQLNAMLRSHDHRGPGNYFGQNYF